MSILSEIPRELLTTVIGGLLGVIISLLLSSSFKKLTVTGFEVSQEITQAAKAQTETVQARTVELLAERLPEIRDTREIAEVLRSIQLQLAREPIILRPEEDPTWTAVENLIDNYHTQALEQARVQFWISIVAAIVGFSMIVYSVYTTDPDQLTYLNILPGAVIDAVAALFFKQSAETRERATELYDRLRKDNQNIRAIQLVNSIENDNIRSVVKGQLALHMAGQEQSPLDFSQFIQSP